MVLETLSDKTDQKRAQGHFFLQKYVENSNICSLEPFTVPCNYLEPINWFELIISNSLTIQ